MGRPERPLDPAGGPLTEFAQELRGLRARAGTPTYAVMGRRVHRSSSVLAEAAGGRSLPTLDTTLAFVAACDGDPAEWEPRWRAVSAALTADSEPESVLPAAHAAPPSLAATSAQSAGWRPGRPQLGILAAALVVVAVAVVWLVVNSSSEAPAAAPAPAPAAESLAITSPAPGGTVSLLDDVVIRRTGHRDGLYVWMTARFEGDVVITAQGPCESPDFVVYTCAKAQFGDPDTPAGTKLRVTAVLVTQEGNLALKSLEGGWNAATRPVQFIAEAPAVIVQR